MFTETANCPRCQADIGPDRIFKDTKPERPGYSEPLIQHVEAKCDSCDTLFELHRVARPGGWEILGNVEIVTERKRHQKFEARLGAVRKFGVTPNAKVA